jgi:transcription elongation factor GreA
MNKTKAGSLMEDKILLTKEGLEKLKKELETLVTFRRPEVVKKIQIARDSGDLSENAAYVSARDEQAFIEGRILELEDIIKNSLVSVGSVGGTSIVVGSKVTVHVEGEEDSFYIVGAPEADPSEKKISHESPLGKALLGKKIGEKVEVDAPIGKLVYTIKSIS